MDQVITFTLEEVWHLILAICGGIVAISGAVAVIVQIIKKLRHPNQKQNEEIAALKQRVDKVEKRLEDGTEQFRKDDIRATKLEMELKDTTKMIVKCLQALMAHEIDGNNTEELKSTKKEIDNYLLEKV